MPSPSRRSLIAAATWTAPVVVASAAAPAYAASTSALDVSLTGFHFDEGESGVHFYLTVTNTSTRTLQGPCTISSIAVSGVNKRTQQPVTGVISSGQTQAPWDDASRSAVFEQNLAPNASFTIDLWLDPFGTYGPFTLTGSAIFSAEGQEAPLSAGLPQGM